MTHLTELQFSMAADGALLPEEFNAIEQHCNQCDDCRLRLAATTLETKVLREIVTINSSAIEVPAFHQPASLRDLGLLAGMIGLVVCLLGIFWQSLQSELLKEVFSWFSAIHITDVNRLVISFVLFIFQEGTIMMEALFSFILFGLLLLAFIATMLMKPKMRGAFSLCFMVVLLSSALTSSPANALEFRRGGDILTIDANETIDDTLVMAGNTAIIDGMVNGDLVVFGNRVIVNGIVSGNLIIFTNSITVAGEIGGSILSFANSIEMADATVGNDLWGFANNTILNGDSNVAGNATIFTNTTTVAGVVGRDLSVFGQSIEISGNVNDDVEAFAQNINLIGDARIGGDIRYRSNNENALKQSPSAVVVGTIEYIAGTRPVIRNKFSTVGFYIGQILRFFCAFIAGIALFWFFPALRNVSLRSGIEGLKTGGIGLLTLVCTPILAVLCAVTVIGLPFAMVGMFAYVAGLYFAKIVLASVLGKLMLSHSENKNNIVSLLAGLALILIIVNLPWVGGVLGFVMTILGLGLIVQQVLSYTASLDS